MLPIILSDKGFSLLEVIIAMLLTTVAVISILPMQDASIRTAGRSDYLGRAAGIMQSELELRENQIMLGTIPASPISQTVHVGGSGSIAGDASFDVTTTTSSPGTNRWLVNVNVAWPGNCAGGTCNITSSILVTRQSGF